MVLTIDKRKNKVILSLGGNVGAVQQVFKTTIKSLEKKIGKLFLSSSLYQTKAWGVENQSDFFNQVIVLTTDLTPITVLKVCLAIEKKLGRVRKKKWHERVIDIDVLFYEQEVLTTEALILPHSYIQHRNFILYPLAEILPEFVHPVLKKTLAALKNNCKDELTVIKI